VTKAINTLGPVSILVNCAGTSVPATFEDAKPEDFKRLMDINYLGSVYVTKACVPSMKKKGGHIVFTSSQAGLLGVYGFSAYAASKFALRGLAETLAMELKPFNIFVTLSCPPDTDTPGFAEEEKLKPAITREISQTAGLVPADVVANGLVNDMLNGKFMSSVGFECAIVRILCSGMSPVTSLSELLIQVHTMGILRLVGFFFLKSFDSIVYRGVMKEKKMEQAKQSSDQTQQSSDQTQTECGQ
jgi:3-dehydrosphinganine reductase